MKPINWKLLRELFGTFFRIGLFTFGGGFAMIPLIEREVVDRKKWLDEEEIIDLIAAAQSLPGPVAVNSATFIGSKLAGRLGAVIAMFGCTLPSVLVILAVAAGLANFQDNLILSNVFRGVRAAVTALILLAAFRLGRKSIHDAATAILACATVIAVFFFKVPAILTIVAGALAGLLICWSVPGVRHRLIGKMPVSAEEHESLEDIDDDAQNR